MLNVLVISSIIANAYLIIELYYTQKDLERYRGHIDTIYGNLVKIGNDIRESNNAG